MDATEKVLIVIGVGFFALLGFMAWQVTAAKPQESMKTTLFSRDENGRIIDIVEKGTYG